MSLYLWLDLGSLLIPIMFSFHPKLQFHKLWYCLFPGIAIMMIVFIIWDIHFTAHGVWGFNPKYLMGAHFLKLPLEEWLFFFCIPYACIFTHYCLIRTVKGYGIGQRWVKNLCILLVPLFLLIAIFNMDKQYTFYNFSLASIILLFTSLWKPKILQTFFLSFLIIMIPFFIVNGILTGSFIAEEVVWYNNEENLGLRMFTIPVEDPWYAFSMLLICILVMEKMGANARWKVKS